MDGKRSVTRQYRAQIIDEDIKSWSRERQACKDDARDIRQQISNLIDSMNVDSSITTNLNYLIDRLVEISACRGTAIGRLSQLDEHQDPLSTDYKIQFVYLKQ